MVTYYLKMEPHLFKDALDEQFQRLSDEKQEAEKLAREQKEQQDKEQKDKAKSGSPDGELVLYRCDHCCLVLAANPACQVCTWLHT